MTAVLLFLGIFVMAFPNPAAAQEGVRFHAPDIPPTLLQKRMAKLRGEAAKATPGLDLRGHLYIPAKGDAPYPALVLLHDCRGITGAIEDWAYQLADWGYIALVVDSYGPRRHRPDCNSYQAMESVDQTFDALGALQFLYQRKDVDPRRIGLIGWSIGGSKVLSALNRIGVQNLYAEKFRFGIAFYPYCLTASGPFIGPLLILIGGADDWTTPRRCITLRDQNMKSEHPLDLNIYPNAVHFFDDPDMGPPRYHGTVENRERSPTRGVTWGYDAAAHGAAKASVRGFLDRQRK
ncbi:MAG: dienelactone hydrolase family protein [Alphaproteobacteria bacterium]